MYARDQHIVEAVKRKLGLVSRLYCVTSGQASSPLLFIGYTDDLRLLTACYQYTVVGIT